MSYKTELQYNNIDLQGLIDLADTLPEAENLTDELNTQDGLIEQILTELDNKSSVSLPEPSNPASPEQILEGYQAIDSAGGFITGSFIPVEPTEFIEETVTASGYALTLSDAVMAKENWLIYNTYDSNTGNSYVIVFLLVKNRSIIFGRETDGKGSTNTPASRELTVIGNSISVITNFYATNFSSGQPYKVIAW